jgi:hypothetical protein
MHADMPRSPRTLARPAGWPSGPARRERVLGALLAAFVSACGGAPSPAPATAATPAAGAADQRWHERAISSYLQGNLAYAQTAAANALQLDPGDVQAREVAARAALARLDTERTLALLADAREPLLVRLRARAHLARGDVRAAHADLASVAGQPPEDAWALAAGPALAAAAEAPVAYALSGDAEATLAFDAREPGALATIPIDIDGRGVHALVSTAAGLTLVDDALAQRGTRLGRVALGGLVVEGVPALARDLADVSGAAGREIGAVIGADLLLRLHATLDGPGRTATFRAQAATPAADGLVRLDLHAFEGTLLAVPVGLGAAPEAFFALDTSAALPVALTPRAARAEGVGARSLPTPRGAPEGVSLVALPALHFRGAVIEDVPALVGVVPDSLARVAGTRIDGLLGLHFFEQVVVTFLPEERTLALAGPTPSTR